MMGLSLSEIDEEIQAIKDVIKVHEDQMTLNEHGLRANNFVLDLVEREKKRLLKK